MENTKRDPNFKLLCVIARDALKADPYAMLADICEAVKMTAAKANIPYATKRDSVRKAIEAELRSPAVRYIGPLREPVRTASHDESVPPRFNQSDVSETLAKAGFQLTRNGFARLEVPQREASTNNAPRFFPSLVKVPE